MQTTTGSSSLTVRPHPLGPEWGTIVEANDPWYRLFRALADLYLAGEIDLDELSEHSTRWLHSGQRIDYLRERYPSASALEGKIALTWMEPDCLCDIYREAACGCPPMDRQERLRQLMGL